MPNGKGGEGLEAAAKGAGTIEGPVRPQRAEPPGPVRAAGRIASIDVLRGFALLGILVMNINMFAFPPVAYKNPLAIGGFDGADRAAWWLSHLFFNYKMMPIFSMLFGAGLVLMHGRYESASRPLRGIWYRRTSWLMLFGLLHGYLLWMGDILFLYGFCGLWIYLFRKKRPGRLLVAAAVFFAVSIPIMIGGGYYMDSLRSEVGAIEAKSESAAEVTGRERAALRQWEDMRRMMYPTGEELEEIIDTYRDGYTGIVAHRAPVYLSMTTYMMLFGSFPPTMGLMLLGMALMKLGVFSASRGRRFYLLLAAGGYAAGIPLARAGAVRMIARDFDFIDVLMHDSVFNHIGGPLVALGHTGLLMLVCSTGALPRVRARLAAVGRMAFSNYISQTVIAVLIFHGFGLGLYASVDRSMLLFFAAGIWVVQLAASPVWLRHFRFGPLEWLWRSLTYLRTQPMRRP